MSESKSIFPIFAKIKESSSGRYRFVGASTLPDRVRERTTDGTIIEGEILSKQTLDSMASMINNKALAGGKLGSYRTISLFHDRVKQKNPELEEAGYVIPGTATVKPLKGFPGNYGLEVEVEVNEKYKPTGKYSDYTPDKIKYKIEKDAIGLSVEYNNRVDQEKIVDVGGEKYRFIMDTDDFRGFGFARVDLIGNPTAVRIKEVFPKISAVYTDKNNEGEVTMEEDIKVKEMEAKLKETEAKLKELEEEKKKKEDEKKKAEEGKEESKAKEIDVKIKEMSSEIAGLKVSMDKDFVKMKESLSNVFESFSPQKPSLNVQSDKNVKIKEAYEALESKDFVKFKEVADAHIEENAAKIKESLKIEGMNFVREDRQSLKIKCVGSEYKADGRMIIVSAKTKDVIDSSDMAESTYYQTNAMFADRYVPGITETFLSEDSYLTAMPKEQFAGGNDKYQWRNWIEYETVTGDSTLSVDPNTTSVTTSEYDFEKFETRIVEYRKGVEVTDFTEYHSMAAIGSLIEKQIMRAAKAVTESMNADLFKPKTDATTGWKGFIGLIGVADSSTYGTIYGKIRTATNRLLDATTANTYVSTSEGISVEVLRNGYEKPLAHGANLASLAIVAHPIQVRRLFNSEDAAIRNNILTMTGAPPTFGFNRSVIPHIDGIPIIRDYRCESSAAAGDMFAVVDFNPMTGHVLVVSKPLNVRPLAKVGLSDKVVMNFWGCTVYKNPLNIFVHTGLTAT